MCLSPLVCRRTFSKPRGFLWRWGLQCCVCCLYRHWSSSPPLRSDRLPGHTPGKRSARSTLQRVSSWRPTVKKQRSRGSSSGGALSWMPSTLGVLRPMLRACGASALWRRGVWSGEERGASVLLLPVTLGEPLNSVFSFLICQVEEKSKIYSFFMKSWKTKVWSYWETL